MGVVMDIGSITQKGQHMYCIGLSIERLWTIPVSARSRVLSALLRICRRMWNPYFSLSKEG